MNLPQFIIATIESAFNQYLLLDSTAMPKFSSMEGKVIAIDIEGLHQSLYLFPSDDGIMILSEFDAEADTRLSGSPIALAKLSLYKNAAPVLFSGEVIITGDTRLGNQFKKILSQINIDWEEIVSQYAGDLVAHKTGNAVREFTKWFKRGKNSMYADIGDYVTEEQLMSPTPAELNRFINGVDDLREGIDRLQAKLQNLVIKK